MTRTHSLVPTMLRREHRRTVPVDHERRTDIRVAQRAQDLSLIHI